MRAFDVVLNSRVIDTVFYSDSTTLDAAEVKHSLINHDGYDPNIEVRERPQRRRADKDRKFRAHASPSTR